MKKFEFTGETKTISLLFRTTTLHRIRAVAEFGLVKIGDLGGWIEKEENLSHEGKAWVYDDAEVCDNAEVCGNAKVYGNGKIWGNAKVYGNAKVCGNAEICGNAEVYGNAKVYGNVKIWGNAKVYGNAKVCGNAEIWGNAEVYGNAKVYGNVKVCGNVKVWGNAEVYGNAKVRGNARVYDDAKVFSARHVLVIGAIGSRNDFTTFYRDKDNEITVKCGCFIGKIDEFLEKVTHTHGDSNYALVYRAAVYVARLQIDLSGEVTNDAAE